MRRSILLLFALLAFLMTSCAPVKWDMKIENQANLVWPPPPNPEKAKYLGQITSFVPTGKSLATILFGKNMEDGLIYKPVAVAVASDGRIAIADLQRLAVHLYDPQLQSYRLITGTPKQKFSSPVSVAFDEQLRLFVADSNLRKVFIFDRDGNYTGEIQGVSPAKPFARPTGITYLAQTNKLYVVDTLANEVDIFDSAGKSLQVIGGRGIGDGKFNMPTHIVGAGGKLFVTDAMNFRAQIFSDTGRFISKFGHHGDGSGDFAMPKGIAYDRWGVVYVAETLFDIVQLFNVNGDYLMSIGGKGTEAGQFWMPSGLFIDRYDKLYVCDTYNKRIQLFQLFDVGTGGGQ